jgi:hypothetical protein
MTRRRNTWNPRCSVQPALNRIQEGLAGVLDNLPNRVVTIFVARFVFRRVCRYFRRARNWVAASRAPSLNPALRSGRRCTR